MKNVIVCDNCGTENAYYKQNCQKCKAYLRTRVVNINLWETISKLLESPVSGFQNIIHAENKNFIIFINFLTGLKLFLFAIMASSVSGSDRIAVDYFFINGGIYLAYTWAIILLFSYAITKLNASFKIENRLKDNVAIYTYSFVPILFSLVILSPVHYALFGSYWFTYNPSPFVIKPTVALVLIIIEGILLIWSILLSIFGTYAQTKNKVYSIVMGLVFWVIITLAVFFLPVLPITL